MIEQLHLGNFDDTLDDTGRLMSLVLGSAAAPPVDDSGIESIFEQGKDRTLAVTIAGLLATSREEGIEPRHAELAERARGAANGAAQDNTSIHYALELTEVLERIENVSFVFDSPPIKTQAAPGVVLLLKEATRAYLFGLSRSCVCVCRALLEVALRDAVSDSELREELSQSKRGELECLISVAGQRRLLPPPLETKAHNIRRAGNKALHGTRPDDSGAWELLQDTRRIVTALYSSA